VIRPEKVEGFLIPNEGLAFTMDSDLLLSPLLFANVLVPVITASAICVSDGLEVNHFATFTFGYLFYWILPIVVGASRIFRMTPAMNPFYDLFDQVPPSSLCIYLTISLCCYLFFLFGHLSTRGLRCRALERYASIHFDRRLLVLYLLLGSALCTLLAYQLRDQLFKGYRVLEEQWRDPLRGTFAGASNFLVCVALIYSVNLEADLGHVITFWQRYVNPYMVAVLLTLVANLSLGERYYVMTTAVMLVTYRSVFVARLRLYTALLLFAVGLTAAGLAGLVRQDININLFGIMCADPLFTSFSLMFFLRELTFSVLRFPTLLLGDLIFLVPTVLLPNKFELIPSVTDAGIPLFNPVGAEHSFLPFMANFGVVGTLGAFFLLGCGVNLIKSGTRVPLLKVIYIFLCAQLAFTIWRDDFAFSLKNILEGTLATPILIFASLNLLTGLLRRGPRVAGHLRQSVY